MRIKFFKSIKEKLAEKEKYFQIGLYVGTIVIAAAYFFFFSDNDLRKHRSLDTKAETLENEIFKLQNYIQNSYSYDEIYNNPKLLEKYVREQLNMKKPDEDVFIIEYK